MGPTFEMKSESILFDNSFAIIPINKNLGQKQLGLQSGLINLHYQQTHNLQAIFNPADFSGWPQVWTRLGLTQNYSKN